MPAKKGTKPPAAGKGRKKGAKGKFTTLKDSFLRAYQVKEGFGGDKALMEYAKKEPDMFLNMIAKLLPKEIDAKLDVTIKPPNLTVKFSDSEEG